VWLARPITVPSHWARVVGLSTLSPVSLLTIGRCAPRGRRAARGVPCSAEHPPRPHQMAGRKSCLGSSITITNDKVKGRVKEAAGALAGNEELKDVVDAVDQRIEEAVERVERMISVAQGASAPVTGNERESIVEGLHEASEDIEQAIEQVDTIVGAAQGAAEATGPTVELPVEELSRATQHVEEAFSGAVLDFRLLYVLQAAGRGRQRQECHQCG
jgi:hypothetical protein